MQNMDSSITKTQKRNLTDMQEKFLDVLFGEAKGNPREAARIAGYSEHSYPKVIRNLKRDNRISGDSLIYTLCQSSYSVNRPTRRRRDHTTL